MKLPSVAGRALDASAEPALPHSVLSVLNSCCGIDSAAVPFQKTSNRHFFDPGEAWTWPLAQPRRELQDAEPQEHYSQCQPSNQNPIFSHEG
jgi:hypothetical protein